MLQTIQYKGDFMSTKNSNNGALSTIFIRNANGEISYGKIGILAAIVAYTVIFNPMFLLGMFEIFIILWLIIGMWKWISSSMSSV